jgi:hypothetical protein
MSTSWRLAGLVPVIVVLISAPAATQSFYGSLITVTQDAQGGVIPGATVVLTNTATNERREGVTGEDGTYRFSTSCPAPTGWKSRTWTLKPDPRDDLVPELRSLWQLQRGRDLLRLELPSARSKLRAVQ